LADPLPINQVGIEKEKDVVIDEIRRRARDHDFLAADHFRKTVFAKNNPLRDEPSVGGDADGIRNIKLEDLKKVSQDVLIPDGLLINVYTEGEIENASLVSRELKRLFEDFPRNEAKHQEIPRELRELINPEFKPGMVSLVNTKLNNGIITTNFVWVVVRKFPDVTYFALKDLSAILDTRLFEHSRKEGWGYHTSVQISTMADNKSALVLRVDTGKKENIEEYAESVLKKAIIEDILPVSRERLELANKLELLRQKAVPLSNKSRLDWMVEGIKDYGKIFDADKVRKIIEQVQAKDLQYWVNLLINTPPAILITGDLE
jgi:predicted Zn-dependent peptidase